MTDLVQLELSEAHELGVLACRAVGADTASTRALISATLAAEMAGKSNVGFGHFPDYLRGFREGRINRKPRTHLSRVMPAFLDCDADMGVAQLGFDLAENEFVSICTELGMGVFTQRNSYSTGELGYYVRRLASHGLMAIAATNANAVLAPSAGTPRTFGTNPLAFAWPMPHGRSPLVIDQSSSETALVNIVAAKDADTSIPLGWAVTSNGEPTTDPVEALAGALLPFGGSKGANIALMVEVMSAGLSGGNWSLDAPKFDSGDQSPSAGLTIIAIKADAREAVSVERVAAHIERLVDLGVYIPGGRHSFEKKIAVPASTYDFIMETIRNA